MNEQTTHQEDNIFATEAIRRGFITVAQLEEARAVQKKLAEMEIVESLSSVMVKRNYLTKDQASALTAAGKDGGKVAIPGYKITAKIGRGGMGTVYKATQLSIGRPVAIKVLSSRLGQDPQYAERFTREAKALAKLNHVNIVTAIDAGKIGNVMYYVMEYVEGESLGELLKRRTKLPEQEALHVTIQVARALEHANTNSIIHRDIKPDNILMDAGGVAKVTDLGLAKSQGEDASLTQTGIAIGTPNYISPEQARGERDLDTRSDIYSLGATLYHMVAGESPFKGSSALEVVTKHLTEQLPSPRNHTPSLSEGICILIDKMMAKRREERYQSPQELMSDLELVMDGKMPKAVRPAVGRSAVMQRMPVVAARQATERRRDTTISPRSSRGTATFATQPIAQKNWVVPAAIAAGVLLLIAILSSLNSRSESLPSSPVARGAPPARRTPQPTPAPIAATPKETPKPSEKQQPKVADAPQPNAPKPVDPVVGVNSIEEIHDRQVQTLSAECVRLRDEGNLAQALDRIDKIKNIQRQYPKIFCDTENLEVSVTAKAEEQFRQFDGAKPEMLVGNMQSLKESLKKVEAAKERQIPKMKANFDPIVADLNKAINGYNAPENVWKRFRSFYAATVKPSIDLPRLNYALAARSVKQELEKKEEYGNEKVRGEMEAVRKEFEEVASFVERLRKVRDFSVDGRGAKIMWPNPDGRGHEGECPIVSTDIAVRIGDDEWFRLDQERLPIMKEVVKREFPDGPKEQKHRRGALLLYAYSGAGYELCEELQNQWKVEGGQDILKRVHEIESNSLACGFARSKGDFFGVADANPKNPVARKEPVNVDAAKPKEPKPEPVNYGKRTIFAGGSLKDKEVRKTMEEWEKDDDIEVAPHKMGFAVGRRKDETKVIPFGEEMDDFEWDIVFRNTKEERTRFYFRTAGEKEKRDGFCVEVKVHNKEHKKWQDVSFKLIEFRKGKEEERDNGEFKGEGIADNGFTYIRIRLQGDRLTLFVNKLPNDRNAKHDLSYQFDDPPRGGIPSIELPRFRQGGERPEALYFSDVILKRLKPETGK